MLAAGASRAKPGSRLRTIHDPPLDRFEQMLFDNSGYSNPMNASPQQILSIRKQQARDLARAWRKVREHEDLEFKWSDDEEPHAEDMDNENRQLYYEGKLGVYNLQLVRKSFEAKGPRSVAIDNLGGIQILKNSDLNVWRNVFEAEMALEAEGAGELE